MIGARTALRQKLGCWLNERWRLEVALRAPRFAKTHGLGWMELCNRHETLRRDETSGGRICLWEFSSALTVARVFPRAGQRLLAHCLDEWPIQLSESSPSQGEAEPDLSVVIGVRGTGRMDQLMACIAAARGQRNASVEIILVEQSWKPEFNGLKLPGVRYLHQQTTSVDMPYNRSWALNAGARHARARHLLLHDADMLLPARAAEVIVAILDKGVDAVRLPRLLFYLDQPTSEAMQRQGKLPETVGMERVIANNRTPIAVRRSTYSSLGGHDEAFYGWGSEDDEFMDRLRTRPIAEGAMMPIIHLWHRSAAAGVSRDINAGLLACARRKPMQQRISELTARNFGAEAPSVQWRGFAAEAA